MSDDAKSGKDGAMKNTGRVVGAIGWRVIILLVAVLVVGGCAGGDDGAASVTLDLSVTPDPPRVGPATIVVTLAEADGAPISGVDLELEGTMTHPGMKPVFADASETSAGRYEATLQFTMGGDWIIIVRGVLPDGSKLEREVDVRGVKTG
jgi:hypothetical protein